MMLQLEKLDRSLTLQDFVDKPKNPASNATILSFKKKSPLTWCYIVRKISWCSQLLGKRKKDGDEKVN